MLDDQHGTPVQLDFPFELSPSGGALAVFLQEEVHAAWAVLLGYAPSLESPEGRDAVALVTVTRVTQVVYGYPNEDAYWKDPRGELGHGFYEIVDSRWVEGIDAYNLRTFGGPYPWYPTGSRRRHFFIGSKDSSAQFLAHDLTLGVFVPRHSVRSEPRPWSASTARAQASSGRRFAAESSDTEAPVGDGFL